jgi:holo-[acyl-carrier protein] synthase
MVSGFMIAFLRPGSRPSVKGRATSLAGRFAVKEAVAKALGTGIGDMRWVDIEIVCDKRGRPELVLHNQARRWPNNWA